MLKQVCSVHNFSIKYSAVFIQISNNFQQYMSMTCSIREMRLVLIPKEIRVLYELEFEQALRSNLLIVFIKTAKRLFHSNLYFYNLKIRGFVALFGPSRDVFSPCNVLLSHFLFQFTVSSVRSACVQHALYVCSSFTVLRSSITRVHRSQSVQRSSITLQHAYVFKKIYISNPGRVRLAFCNFLIESLFNQELLKDIYLFIFHFCKPFSKFAGRERKIAKTSDSLFYNTIKQLGKILVF